MSEWTVPVRNDPFLALPRRAFLLPASLCTCFLAGFIPVTIGPSSSSHQPRFSHGGKYSVYSHTCTCPGLCWAFIHAARRCNRKNCKSDGGAGSSRYISAGEPKCKGVRFSCERARAWLRPRLRDRRSLRPAPQCVGGWQRAGRRVSIRFTAVSKPCVSAWGN